MKVDSATIDACLGSLVDRIPESYYRGTHARACARLPGLLFSDYAIETVLKYARRISPPDGSLDFEQDCSQFDEFAEALRLEMIVSEELGAELMQEIVKFIKIDLKEVDRFRQPKVGWLWFSPMIGLQPLEATQSGFSAEDAGLWGFSLGIVGTKGPDCGALIARYALDLARVPELASRISTLQDYQRDAELRLRLMAETIPLVPK